MSPDNIKEKIYYTVGHNIPVWAREITQSICREIFYKYTRSNTRLIFLVISFQNPCKQIKTNNVTRLFSLPQRFHGKTQTRRSFISSHTLINVSILLHWSKLQGTLYHSKSFKKSKERVSSVTNHLSLFHQLLHTGPQCRPILLRQETQCRFQSQRDSHWSIVISLVSNPVDVFSLLLGYCRCSTFLDWCQGVGSQSKFLGPDFQTKLFLYGRIRRDQK